MNIEIKKGMVFLGCSFTWGQGLYYYSKMNTLKRPPAEQFSYDLLTAAHIKYMESNRYARLVANHFNTFEICRDQNGGSEEQSLNFLNHIFNEERYKLNSAHKNLYSYDEVSHIIVQTSVPVRNPYLAEINGKIERLEWYNDDKQKQKLFFKWLSDNGINSQPEFYDRLIRQWFDNLKSSFEFFENKGIKCYILCWHDDYVGLIKKDSWMYDRYIDFEYQNEKYSCLDHLCRSNDNMLIKDDFENLGPNPPKDSHPSLICHKIISNNIIKKLENK